MAIAHLEVTSPDLSGGRVPVECTCDGDNVVPRLQWSRGPEGTRSFAVVVDDPDATHPHFAHWLVWNIGPHEHELDASKVHAFVQGINDFGEIGWAGPCPPRGDKPHRYVFRVYALDSELKVEPTTSRDQLIEALGAHLLAQGELVATYQRQLSRVFGETPTHP
jgi:Raf kinase inhibitor-like YbhB/YbcL family protein